LNKLIIEGITFIVKLIIIKFIYFEG
jgi:hypothetical protein